MIWIAFGKWSHADGRFSIRDRIYRDGHKWTPFVKVVNRYSVLDKEGRKTIWIKSFERHGIVYQIARVLGWFPGSAYRGYMGWVGDHSIRRRFRSRQG